MKSYHPDYHISWTPEVIAKCRDAALQLLEEVGLQVKHEAFVGSIKKHDGVRVSGDRVFLSRELAEKHFDIYLAAQREKLLGRMESDDKWAISNNGYSIMVVDIETDEVRDATQRDLRDLIRLLNSFDMKGSYPCCPQDLPPLMRALATFKICWEESENIRPFDYLDPRQTPFLYEMHKVMGKPLTINVNIAQTMSVSEEDIEAFMRWYPIWEKNKSEIAWYSICDYPMIGVNRPITATGSVTAYLAQSYGAHTMFQLFDPEINMAPRMSAGMPVDLKNMCWAWGSPKMHLYHFLNDTIMPALCGIPIDSYRCKSGFMCTSSCAVDARSGMEKMATGLTAALQGARSFSGAGNLAVDDLFSGVQLLLDVEIFEYIKETVESFSPHADLMSPDGLFDVIRDCAVGGDEFYAHPDTASKVRTLLPVSNRRPHQKLRSWMMDKKNIKDRLREECRERIRNQEPFQLDTARKQALEKIYSNAEKELR